MARCIPVSYTHLDVYKRQYIYVVNDSNIVRFRHIETGQLIGDSLRQIRAGITPRERYVDVYKRQV